MNNTILIGPVIIQQTWVILAGGLLLGYMVLTHISPFRGKEWKEFRATVGTGIGMFVIIFFYGTILIQINLLLTDPFAVLSYPSGSRELYIALLVVFFYYVSMSLKKKVFVTQYIQGILYLLLPVTFVYAFFEKKQGVELPPSFSNFVPWTHHPVFLYVMCITGALLLWLLRLEKQENMDSKVLTIYMLWVFGLLLTTIVDNYPLFFGTPITPLFYFMLLITGLGIGISRKKQRR